MRICFQMSYSRISACLPSIRCYWGELPAKECKIDHQLVSVLAQTYMKDGLPTRIISQLEWVKSPAHYPSFPPSSSSNAEPIEPQLQILRSRKQLQETAIFGGASNL